MIPVRFDVVPSDRHVLILSRGQMARYAYFSDFCFEDEGVCWWQTCPIIVCALVQEEFRPIKVGMYNFPRFRRCDLAEMWFLPNAMRS